MIDARSFVDDWGPPKFAPPFTFFGGLGIVANGNRACERERFRERVDVERGESSMRRGEHRRQVHAAVAANEEIRCAEAEAITMEQGYVTHPK